MEETDATPRMDSLQRLLAPYGPRLPLVQLVEELNRLYHAVEARDYDQKHVEIMDQLPSLWQEMIERVSRHGGSAPLRILNFGCGTGFEASQLLRILPQERIAALTCYDPAPEMLHRCREKIASRFPAAFFCGDLKQLPADGPGYNLLVTNSVLHHLPDPMETVKKLLSHLVTDAVWLAGHEPSSRFYRNSECNSALQRFQRERRWRRFLQPGYYGRHLQSLLGRRSSPARVAAREALRRRLFDKKPSGRLVARLVDFHVPHSYAEVAAGRGSDFDFKTLQKDFAGVWEMDWIKTYSFMGPFYEGGLPVKWHRVCRQLAEKFPDDGCNFCSVWVRVS